MALTIQQAVDGIQARHGGGNYNARYDNTDANGNYRIQVSEFVVDHTVTYDWFTVNPTTGAYTSDFNGLSGNLNDFTVIDKLNVNSIEVGYGRLNPAPTTQAAFVDFHSSGGGHKDSANPIDYDGRIIVWGGDKAVTGKGTMDLIAENVDFIKGSTGGWAQASGIINHTNSYLNVHAFSSSYGSGNAQVWYNANEGSLNIWKSSGGHAYLRASDFVVSSKREFKRNIVKDESSALDKVMATPVYDYHYHEDIEPLEYDEKTGQHKLSGIKHDPATIKKRKGLIVEEAPEEIIHASGDAINIYAMAAMSWKAIQELSAELEAVKQELAELKK